MHQWVTSAPSHRLGEVERGVNRIQQTAVPMLFQATPYPFDRIVLTVIGGIVGQLSRHMRCINKLHHALNELGASTMALRTIILVDQQGRDMGKTWTGGLPEQGQTIHQTITGDLGYDEIQVGFPEVGQENPYRVQYGVRLEIMVCRLHVHAGLPAPRKGANGHSGFRIDGYS